MEYSIIVPAYNESERLKPTLLEILSYFITHKVSFEVLVVEDGSTDNTPVLVKELEREYPNLRLLQMPQNFGKGFAVKTGMLNARGKFLLFTDADGATPIEEFARLKSAIDQGADVAIGSRALFSADTKVEAQLHRKIIGRIFSKLVELLAVAGIADTQCGFKLFTKAAADQLFTFQKSKGFSFDVEILFLANKLGFTITEVPVNWSDKPGSKVNLVFDPLKMLIDLFRFRIIHRNIAKG